MGPISHPRLQDGAEAAAATTTKGASVRGAAKKLVLFVIWSVGGAADLGSRHSGSSLPPSHPFGRDDIGNGQKEGEGRGTAEGEKTEGSRGSRGGEEGSEGWKAFFLSPAIPLSDRRGRAVVAPSAPLVTLLFSRVETSAPRHRVRLWSTAAVANGRFSSRSVRVIESWRRSGDEKARRAAGTFRILGQEMAKSRGSRSVARPSFVPPS